MDSVNWPLALVVFGPVVGAAVMLIMIFRGHKPKAGTHGGVAFAWEYHPPSRQGPAQVRVSVPARSTGGFEIARETSMDAHAKRIGLSREVQTGDPRFDGHFSSPPGPTVSPEPFSPGKNAAKPC